MKKTLILPALILAVLIGAGSSAQAQLKVGTIDMSKVFSSYYKTKDAQSRIEAAKTKAKSEIDDKMDALKKSAMEIKKLQDDAGNAALSKEAKEEKLKQLEDRKNQFGPAQRELQEFQQTQERQLQDQLLRMRNGIVEEIMKLVNDRIKSEQYDLVFDKSGNSSNGVPIVIYARDSYDFSDDIIAQLNKNKPADSAAPAADAKKADDKKK